MAGADGALSPAVPTSVFDGLAQRRMVVISGKGGVGRTTLSALTGLALARRGRKVLVCTTGHDDRLAWMLGAARLDDRPQQVAPRLSIVRLVPQTAIREYGGLVMRSQRISDAVFDNGVVKRLLRAIPGLDHFAVVGKAWHEAVRGGQYDCVVFDGPATGHLLYTLGVPQAIMQTIPVGPLTKEAGLMQESFEDPERVQALLVGLPELWPLTELGELGAALRDKVRMNVAAIVVNGTWPSAIPELDDADLGAHSIAAEVARIAEVARCQRGDVDSWAASEAAGRCGVGGWMELPWRWEGIANLADTEALLATIDRGWSEGQEAG